jgi:hypothetical protein
MSAVMTACAVLVSLRGMQARQLAGCVTARATRCCAYALLRMNAVALRAATSQLAVVLLGFGGMALPALGRGQLVAFMRRVAREAIAMHRGSALELFGVALAAAHSARVCIVTDGALLVLGTRMHVRMAAGARQRRQARRVNVCSVATSTLSVPLIVRDAGQLRCVTASACLCLSRLRKVVRHMTIGAGSVCAVRRLIVVRLAVAARASLRRCYGLLLRMRRMAARTRVTQSRRMLGRHFVVA